MSVDDDPSLGPADAPITIIEFSDFNCPYCEKWHVETFRPLLAAYPHQIRFVYRDFPITSAESLVVRRRLRTAPRIRTPTGLFTMRCFPGDWISGARPMRNTPRA